MSRKVPQQLLLTAVAILVAACGDGGPDSETIRQALQGQMSDGWTVVEVAIDSSRPEDAADLPMWTTYFTAQARSSTSLYALEVRENIVNFVSQVAEAGTPRELEGWARAVGTDEGKWILDTVEWTPGPAGLAGTPLSEYAGIVVVDGTDSEAEFHRARSSALESIYDGSYFKGREVLPRSRRASPLSSGSSVNIRFTDFDPETREVQGQVTWGGLSDDSEKRFVGTVDEDGKASLKEVEWVRETAWYPITGRKLGVTYELEPNLTLTRLEGRWMYEDGNGRRRSGRLELVNYRQIPHWLEELHDES